MYTKIGGGRIIGEWYIGFEYIYSTIIGKIGKLGCILRRHTRSDLGTSKQQNFTFTFIYIQLGVSGVLDFDSTFHFGVLGVQYFSISQPISKSISKSHLGVLGGQFFCIFKHILLTFRISFWGLWVVIFSYFQNPFQEYFCSRFALRKSKNHLISKKPMLTHHTLALARR